MNDIIKEFKLNYLIFSVAFMIFGAVLLIYPDITSKAIFYFLGAILLISGAFCIIRYFISAHDPFIRSDLFTGLVLCALGVFSILGAELIISALVYIFGIVVLVSGFFMVQSAVDLKKYGIEKWWMELIGALVTIAFGVVLLCNPFEAMEATVMIIGASLIIGGISALVSSLFFSKINRQIKKELKAQEDNR